MQRFDPVQFCANIERYKITCSLVVPPVLVVLARHPGMWNTLASELIVFTTIISCRPIRSVLSTNIIFGCSTFERTFGAAGGFLLGHSRFVDSRKMLGDCQAFE